MTTSFPTVSELSELAAFVVNLETIIEKIANRVDAPPEDIDGMKAAMTCARDRGVVTLAAFCKVMYEDLNEDLLK